MNNRKLFGIFILLCITATLFVISKKPIPSPEPKSISIISLPTSTPTPIVYPKVDHYNPPIIPNQSAYTLIFVGDSMTEALGPNFDALRLILKDSYPHKDFGLFNYGFGSSNILSVDDRLSGDITYQGTTYEAILNRYFDVILIESFGNNPLSELSLDQGLAKQTSTLDDLVAKINYTHPESLIVFIATIAPSQALYGKGSRDLSVETRTKWANERRAYIENHINYAKSHNIPLINVYEKSLDKNGLTLTKYLDPGNYIHPSAEGVKLISQTIANFLFDNKVLTP